VAAAVRERRLPLVLLGDNSDPTLSQVVVDDFAGAFAATKYLIGLGHQRVMLFVHESIKPHCSVQERLGGYRAAMQEANLPVRELIRVDEGTAVDVLARGKERPTAALCYSDMESTLLVHGLWQIGVKIPGDVSLIGFNDVFSTQYMTPPLTTVGFDAAKIGEAGAKQVLKDSDAAADSMEPTVVTIHPNLIIRGSTGPAKTT
jgi:DNA-binding LacI/PurR family transcriptional regulator